jgi:hypothetical protein
MKRIPEEVSRLMSAVTEAQIACASSRKQPAECRDRNPGIRLPLEQQLPYIKRQTAGQGAADAGHPKTGAAGQEERAAAREKTAEGAAGHEGGAAGHGERAVGQESTLPTGAALPASLPETKTRPNKKDRDPQGIAKVESEEGEEPMLVLDDEDELYFQDVAYALAEAERMRQRSRHLRAPWS